MYNISQKIVPRNVGFDCVDVVFKPDFGTLGKLQEQFGNDIDLMISKPQYRDLVNANLRPIEVESDMPYIDGMSDADKLSLLPSREFDNNELAEYARTIAKDYKKSN